jgi:hypothetical protein
MNLDDVIKYAEHTASNGDREWCEYHKQIAEWLKDYKRLLEKETYIKEIYEKSLEIDDYYDKQWNDYYNNIINNSKGFSEEEKKIYKQMLINKSIKLKDNEINNLKKEVDK